MSKRKKAGKGSALINIFSNNKIVIIISFILAVVIWFAYSMTVAPERTRVISDVPVTVNLTNSVAEQLGLKAYGYEDITVEVEVSGKGYSVGQVTAEDIVISFQNLNQIDDAGYKTLQLNVRSDDGSFNVESVSPKYIEVYFDFPETRKFEVNHKVVEPEGGIADTGYYYGGAVYGAKELSISGPKSELDKITEVVAETTVSDRLSKTTSMSAQVSLRTSDGQEPKFISYDDSQVKEVSFSIQKTKSLKFMAQFDNLPEYYKNEPLSVTYSPSELLVAGTDSQITSLAYFELAPIDFRQLSPGNNTFEFDVTAPGGITVIDETEKVSVTVDMSNFAMAQFDLRAENIVTNLPAEYTLVEIRPVSGVQIVAPKQVVDSITSDALVAEIDLSGVTLTPGVNTVELNISVKNRNDCWAYGTYTTTIVLN